MVDVKETWTDLTVERAVRLPVYVVSLTTQNIDVRKPM